MAERFWELSHFGCVHLKYLLCGARYNFPFAMKSRLFILLALVAVSFIFIQTNFAFETYLKAEKWMKKERVSSTYKIKVRSVELNDVAADYKKKSRALGIHPLKNAHHLDSLADAGKLTRVDGGRYYKVDKLTHSYPYLTPNTAELLDTISSRFSAELKGTDLKGAQLHVTSLLRTLESNKKLRKNNSNASEESAHLRGIAFDISYTRYHTSVQWFFRKVFVPVKSYSQTKFLKETLAKVLSDLKKEGKCWVTYEKKQSCFHVVSRF